MFLELVFKYIPIKSPSRVSIGRTDNDEDYLYFFLDDVYGHIAENNEIKYLAFTSTEKIKEAIKIYKNFGKKIHEH